MRERFTTGSAFERDYAYSRVVAVGDTLYVAGTTGFEYTTMTISDDVAVQCAQTFENIQAALQKAGSGLHDVVRVIYYVTEPGDFAKCREPIARYMTDARPAATMVVAQLLDSRMKIEIEVTAVRSASVAG